MHALCWHGKEDVRVEDVPEPKIINPEDVLIAVTATAICGSDLHLYNDLIPTMKSGDILGHEFMGEIIETGKDITELKKGDRVVVPFVMSCGMCFFCKKGLFACCDFSNPNQALAKERMGQAPAGMFGYSHMMGGFSGGQAEYVRVPYANNGPIKIPESMGDEEVLFLSDILPTGYMAAENANIHPGDTVAIWGCGPVAQFAIQSAWLLGAGRVIAIDCIPERLELARLAGKAETINFEKEDVYDALYVMTQGKGADCCIDAVGTEAHAPTFDAAVDRLKLAASLGSDRAHVLREAIKCCRKGGTISCPGVYINMIDNFPFGAAMNKGLTFKMGQTHVQRYIGYLLEEVIKGTFHPQEIITHRFDLKDAKKAYEIFNNKEDGCIKVVLKP